MPDIASSVSKKAEFRSWVKDVKSRWTETFNNTPASPSMDSLTPAIQERMMRCGVEARHFQIDGVEDRDSLVLLAFCTLLLDDIKYSSTVNDITKTWGYTGG
jgi:hypothetical protein